MRSELAQPNQGGADINPNLGPLHTPAIETSFGASKLAASLAIAAGAIGGSVLLEMTDGRRIHTGLNVVVATNAPGPVMDELATILAPIKDEQMRRHLALAQLDVKSHQRLIEEVEAERAEYMANDSMPPAEHLAYFDQRLAELHGLARPMMLLQNPEPGRLTSGIGKSADACLLATYDDLSFLGLLNAARTARGAMDFELLGKAFRQEIFDAAYLEGITEVPVVSPIVSMVAVVRPETAARFLSSQLPLVAGFADTCLVVYDAHDTTSGSNAVDLTDSVAKWHQNASRMLASRDGPTRIIHLSPEANEGLAGFSSRVAETQRQAPTAESRHLSHSPLITAKLALLLHLTQDDASSSIPGQIAASAVTAAELASQHRTALLAAECTEPATKALQAAIFQKIANLGPLTSMRDICRHSRGLRIDRLVPILNELVASGKVVKDQSGRYSTASVVLLATG